MLKTVILMGKENTFCPLSSLQCTAIPFFCHLRLSTTDLFPFIPTELFDVQSERKVSAYHSDHVLTASHR